MLKYMDATSDFDDLYYIKWKFTQDRYKNKICQNIITLDVESSSGFYDNATGKVHGFNHKKYANNARYRHTIDNAMPVSLVYIWQVAVESSDGYIYGFYGRTSESFLDFWEQLSAVIRGASNTTKKGKVKTFIYVHNLSMEFNIFLRNVTARYMNADFTVFARSTHKPIYARIKVGAVQFEYRCSYFLTNKSLKNWSEDEQLPVQKQAPIDYLPVRTPTTPLTDEIIDYAMADVVTMVYGLEKYRDKYGTIENIPLTSTGEIRRVLQSTAVQNPDFAQLCYEISQSYDYDMFIKLTKVYSGGWTHGNSRYIGKVIRNDNPDLSLGGVDFASSYPSVMCNFAGFPVSKFTEVDPAQFAMYESEDIEHPQHTWFAKIEFCNVTSKTQNTLWSLSKCEEVSTANSRIDNGRIEHVDHMVIYCCALDFDTIKRVYSYDWFKVHELYVADAGRLPKVLVEVVLNAYADKTALKGVDGAESRYSSQKALINGVYGLECYRKLNWIVSYKDGEWDKFFPTKEMGGEGFYDEILDEEDPQKSFTWYASGVWITAAARWRLWQAIIAMDEHTIYCDTDSLKGLLSKEDIQWIEDFNAHIIDESMKAAQYHGIDPALYCPKTKKGEPKPLGIFEIDTPKGCKPLDPNKPYGIYAGLVVQGAKRYCYVGSDNKIHTTVAGLPKKAGPKVIKKLEDFNDGAEWDTKQSGRLTVYYTEAPDNIEWNGVGNSRYTSHEKFCVCMKPTTFNMSLSEQFRAFLEFIQGQVDDEFVDDNNIMLW